MPARSGSVTGIVVRTNRIPNGELKLSVGRFYGRGRGKVRTNRIPNGELKLIQEGDARYLEVKVRTNRIPNGELKRG